MKKFPYAHATHPDWRIAVEIVLAQLRAQQQNALYADEPSLGIIYITDFFAEFAVGILNQLQNSLPYVKDWSGTVGVGVCSNNVEYFDEPALSVMLCDVEPEHYKIFNGLKPLSVLLGKDFPADVALIHADAHTPELDELIVELAECTEQQYLFGGLASSRGESVQFSSTHSGTNVVQGLSSQDLGEQAPDRNGVFMGGLSGVVFDSSVKIMTRVTQGCYPISKNRVVTKCDRQMLLELDGKPALDVLLEDLQTSLEEPRERMLNKIRNTLAGIGERLDEMTNKAGALQDNAIVRHIIGLDLQRKGVALAHELHVGMQLSFCERNVKAAKADLMRIGAEIRETLEPQELSPIEAEILNDSILDNLPQMASKIAGAIYVSCAARGGPHFGFPSAELQILNRALGDVPLTGFFAAGEIAQKNLYGYTGVLTVFVMD